MFIGIPIGHTESEAESQFLLADTKLSQACLIASTCDRAGPLNVYVEYNKEKFCIAVLNPKISWCCPIELMFTAGSEVKFFLSRKCIVHLTGFETSNYLDDYESSSSSEGCILTFDTSTDDEVPRGGKRPKFGERPRTRDEGSFVKPRPAGPVAMRPVRVEARKPVKIETRTVPKPEVKRPARTETKSPRQTETKSPRQTETKSPRQSTEGTSRGAPPDTEEESDIDYASEKMEDEDENDLFEPSSEDME